MPEITFTPELEARMAAYQAKRQARIDRLRDRATKAQQESTTLYQRWDERSAMIPFGQPILVGHYSEGRDRRFRARLSRMLDHSMAQAQAADRLRDRADSAEANRAIFSDDPLATMKLEEKLAHLEARQAAMKRINKICQALKLSKERPESAEKLRHAVAAGQLTENDVLALMRACTHHWRPEIRFPGDVLTNNNANIRRLKQRITQLDHQAAHVAEDQTINGIQIIDNAEDNRLQLFFPDKPPDAIRKELKAAGFRWAPSVGAWQRHRSNAALYWAQQIAGQRS